MILKRLKLNTGFVEPTNSYIIQDEESKETIVIDPGGEPEKIIEMLKILDAKVKYIYLTHCHADHIEAVNPLQESVGGTILIHRTEAENLNKDNINLATYIGLPEIKLQADSRIDDGDLIHIGNLEFKVIHTPGHTNGSTSLYLEKEKLLFSGDTLFRGAWGRTDLPTSSFEEVIASITNKLITLPEDTIVYPGHGKSTMIREEKPIYLDLQPRSEF